MSVKSAASTLRQFVERVQSTKIVDKQNELKEIIEGPLALAKEKGRLLETDEADAVLSRVDLSYRTDLVRNVIGIFNEEVERGTVILSEVETCLSDLQALLDTIQQRIYSDKQKQQLNTENLTVILGLYETARAVLVYLKVRNEILRQNLLVPFDESTSRKTSLGSIEEGDFLLGISKLETSCLLGYL